ncbi:hypothetical protein HKD37_19G053351 [Glycine soja]
MATPPSSHLPPPPSLTGATSQSPSTLKRTRKATWLRSLVTRPVGAERPLVHVNLATKKADGPHRKKLRTYLGIAEFNIPKASDLRTKKKILQTVGERWRQFKSNLTSNGHLQLTRKVSTTLYAKSTTLARRSGPNFVRPAETLRGRMCEKRHRPSRSKTLPLTCCLMARTKKTGQMTSEAAKEIVDNIDSLEDQASQGSFVAHGRQDVLTAAIGRPAHPGCVRAAGAGVTIKQYFGPAPRTSRTSSSMAPEDLEQLTQQIRDQLEESIIEKVTQQLMLSFSQMQSQFQLQMQSQRLALPPEPGTKESCVDPLGNDLDTGDSDNCRLYIEENSPHLVALGRVYEGSTTVQNIPLLHDQVKVGVEEVRDANAPILVPIEEVKLVAQTFNTFLAWLTHLVKRLSEQGVVGPTKPADRLDHDVDDPLYLMTLTIPQLFLKPLQVMWDATVFGVFNEDFPLYIKYEDLSKIAHGGQCLSISIIQLWILHMTETSMRAGNVNVYGFLKPQSIQRSRQSQFESKSYIKN